MVWTIAGSDSGGGAGIQADLLTFHDFQVHGCSVITALTAQNSHAVDHVQVTGADNLAAQIHSLHSDLPARAIKLGMLANAQVINIVADYLDTYTGFVVCDPVMVSTSGGELLVDDARDAILRRLLPRVDLVTPNIEEAGRLCGMTVRSRDDMVRAADKLLALGARSVLITGGHTEAVAGRLADYYASADERFWLAGELIESVHTHGSGCTLSAAIAAAVGAGYELADALVLAKTYVTAGIRLGRQLGAGPGPVAHRGWPDQLVDLPALYRQPFSALAAFPVIEGELGLYAVVDSAEWVEKMVAEAVPTIQLRLKSGTADELETAIVRARDAVRGSTSRLFINDHWALAIKHGVYGVHLGQEDLDTADLSAIAAAGLRLGVSTHSYAEIARAHGVRPSYIAIGPIYPTTTKVMRFEQQGLDRLARWVHLLKPGYVLTAIGGISVARAPGVLATGVGSVAVVSAITDAPDYRRAVSDLLQAHVAA